MPLFLALKDYEDVSKKKVGKKLRNESTVADNTKRIRLKERQRIGLAPAVAAARNLRAGGLVTAANHDGMSIADRARFFERNTPANLANRQAALNAEVIRQRQWLSRQGAIFKGDDDIDESRLKDRVVVYDNDLAAQGATKIRISAGRFLHFSNNQPLDTEKMVTHHSGPGYAIFVVSEQGFFHVANHKVGQYHHSSLLGGARVPCAGELKVRNGELIEITNKSGHYKPKNKHLLHALFLIQLGGSSMGFKVGALAEGANSWTVTPYPCVLAFMQAIGQDNATYLAEQEAERRENELEAIALAGPRLDSYGNVIPDGEGVRLDNYGNVILD